MELMGQARFGQQYPGRLWTWWSGSCWMGACLAISLAFATLHSPLSKGPFSSSESGLKCSAWTAALGFQPTCQRRPKALTLCAWNFAGGWALAGAACLIVLPLCPSAALIPPHTVYLMCWDVSRHGKFVGSRIWPKEGSIGSGPYAFFLTSIRLRGRWNAQACCKDLLSAQVLYPVPLVVKVR
jgi:hypothetical protein